MSDIKKSSPLKRFGLPLGILVGAIVVSQVILSNPPEARRMGQAPAPKMTVDVMRITPQSYQVELDSFGVVKPRTNSVLVAQASGQINHINPNFRDGGFFEQGDVLLTLDDRDHKAEVKVAQANLLDAKQKLAEEVARGEQAATDWKRLGKGDANDLVLRKPQLEAAKAKVLSSEAQLEKAQLALERTRIIAPYAGRVLSKKVDLGQVVSNNAQLADIYAVDYVEIRLPINNQDLALIELPEEYRFSDQSNSNQGEVSFVSDLGDGYHWQGKVVRTEGAIDENSQQLYVVAQIDDPYGKNNQQAPIKIGQYVNARIMGKQLENALLIPNKSIYQGSYVYIVENNLLMRKPVELIWKNEQDAIIKTGLRAGQQLVITPLGQVNSGTPVSINNGDRKQSNAVNSSGPDLDKVLERMPEKRRKALEKAAEEAGISTREMLKKRMEKRRAKQGAQS